MKKVSEKTQGLSINFKRDSEEGHVLCATVERTVARRVANRQFRLILTQFDKIKTLANEVQSFQLTNIPECTVYLLAVVVRPMSKVAQTATLLTCMW